VKRGGTVEATTDVVFNIETHTPTDIAGTSATFTAEFTSLGGADSVEMLFTYWEQGNKSSTQGYTDWQSVSTPSTVSTSVNGLRPDSTYVIKAIAHRIDTDEWNGGGLVDITTDQGFSVDTQPVSDVTGNSAKFNVDVLGLGGADSIELLFTYWEQDGKSSTQRYTEWQTVSTASIISTSVTDLQVGTTYVAKAIAHRPDTGEWTGGGGVEFTA
jgi:hypothetical protein